MDNDDCYSKQEKVHRYNNTPSQRTKYSND